MLNLLLNVSYRVFSHNTLLIVYGILNILPSAWLLMGTFWCIWYSCSLSFCFSRYRNFGYWLIYGPKYEDGEWKIRTNRELEELNKGENIAKLIKGQRISWLSHLERMEEDRMPKKIFSQELEGTRRRGRPRKG